MAAWHTTRSCVAASNPKSGAGPHSSGFHNGWPYGWMPHLMRAGG
ncbi:hypothetical protein F442_06729 [Phytophthora nicotianae P10297]|uniref:Uncharacterized protein n=2 Tax=Phytophthora nicotianae TaxID=4792 RepID=W2ZLU9_PHYNI|nr:hypothetical protein F444_06761 [Phytophthora nicotianae P1976]ETP47179.1 hypothetical protein F442_06729 [Phytophthora nicotianae P10297]